MDKYPENLLWAIQIPNHVAFAKNTCAGMFEIKGFKVGSRTVGCCEHIATVLCYPSYLRNQTGEVLSETNYCGTVNVLDAADTNLHSKCRVCTVIIRFFHTKCQGALTFVLLFSLLVFINQR